MQLRLSWTCRDWDGVMVGISRKIYAREGLEDHEGLESTMTTGDKSFATGGVTKTKRNFEPLKAGDWDLKLLKQVEIKTAEPRKIEKGDHAGEMSRPVPRVGLRFEALE